jgi:hypothetical protein
MRHRVMVLTLGAMLVGMVAGGWAALVRAGTASRHDGEVEAVDLRTRTLTLSELAEGGTARTLHVQVPPNATIVRSERLPADQVKELEHPFKDTPLRLSDVRPGDFVVVELSRTGKRAEASSVTVTLEP